MSGQVLAFGSCWTCKQPFWFDPDLVLSVPIDPASGLPPDLGGDPGRARREPLCPPCGENIAVARARAGRPPLPPPPLGGAR